MKATMFGVPASHPSLAAELMLRHKRIPYRRIDLVSALHRVLVRALGFAGATVPAVRIDGQRIQGTRELSRALDALVPEPPLFPADPARRAVEEAETWGEEVYQPVPRRLVWAAMKRDRSPAESYLQGSHMGVPTAIAARAVAPVVAAAAYLNDAGDDNVRRDFAELPALLDRVDELLAAGTIGGPELNAADFQIGTTTGLLATLEDTHPYLEGRPAAEHARRVAPGYPGRMPPVFPSAWLQR